MTNLRSPGSLLTLCLLATFNLACSSGSDNNSSNPTGPSAPSVSLQGTWAGTTSSLSATGTCLANNFGPLTVPVRWTFQQSGNSFTASQTVNSFLTCPFRGTISGNSITVLPDGTSGPTFCSFTTGRCSGRLVELRLRTNQAILTATVNGTTMNATATSVFDVFDAQTGQSLGTYTVRGSQSLTKQ